MSLPASNNYMWGIAQERGPILQIWVRTKSYLHSNVEKNTSMLFFFKGM